MAIKRGVENDPLVCFDYGLPRPRIPLHPYYTSKWPGKKRDDRIHSQSPRAALRAVVCRKAVSWELKLEVMHDPWVVFDHGLTHSRLPLCLRDTRKWSEENGEGRTPLTKACTALKVDAVQKLVSWNFHEMDDGCDP
ncbi:Uncharacterized protein Rs2_09827 [Raphanus sativus]|nr:Uncharacterized protein Rs2_09827 [Raphanus sativus]